MEKASYSLVEIMSTSAPLAHWPRLAEPLANTPYSPAPEPEEPDVRFTINLGLLAPVYDQKHPEKNEPLEHGRWYVDLAERRNATHPPRSYKLPKSPLYMTKGKCGAKDPKTSPTSVHGCAGHEAHQKTNPGRRDVSTVKFSASSDP